jgi:hypothetical protein
MELSKVSRRGRGASASMVVFVRGEKIRTLGDRGRQRR